MASNYSVQKGMERNARVHKVFTLEAHTARLCAMDDDVAVKRYFRLKIVGGPRARTRPQL